MVKARFNAARTVMRETANTLKLLVDALFDPLVVVTAMTTLALIIGVLAYFSPGAPPSKWVALLCYLIAAIGITTMLFQVKKIWTRNYIVRRLGEFLAAGQHLMRCCRNEGADAPEPESNQWAEEVEGFLQRYCNESYVHRFRSSAGLPLTATPITSLTHRNLWSGLYTRVARLEQFLSELGRV